MMKMEEYTLKEMFSSGSGGGVSHKRCFLNLVPNFLEIIVVILQVLVEIKSREIYQF